MNVGHFLQTNWPTLVVAAPGLWAVWKRWDDKRQARKAADAQAELDIAANEAAEAAAKVELVELVQKISGDLVTNLHEEIARGNERNSATEARLEKVERDFAEFRRRHDNMIADKDARIVMLEGQVRTKDAELRFLRDILKRHNIPEPVQGREYWQVTDEGLKPLLEDDLRNDRRREPRDEDLP